MRSLLYRRWWSVIAICMIAGLALAYATHRRTGPAMLMLSVDHDVLTADGFAEAQVTAHASDGRELQVVTWRIEKGKDLADMEEFAPVGRGIRAVYRAGVTP